MNDNKALLILNPTELIHTRWGIVAMYENMHINVIYCMVHSDVIGTSFDNILNENI